tara:strand:+ start:5609 stop:6493 length:885 start_codon:yes stop_codon:yes gene_type:complete
MSAKFFYYPQPKGNFPVTIDLGEDLGELFSEFIVDAVDGIGIDGSIQRSVTRMGEIITIQRDRLKLGEDIAYQMMAMQNHLDRGFSVGFTADHTKAWAAPIHNYLSSGSFNINVFANPFSNYLGTNIPAVDDYVVVESAPPAQLQEMHKIASVSNLSSTGGSLTVDKRINFQYNRRAYVRHYRTWPVLKRINADIGQNIITNEGGRLFSLSIRLVPDYHTLFGFHPENYDGVVNVGGLLSTEPEATGTIPDGRNDSGIDGVLPKFSGGRIDLEMPADIELPAKFGDGSGTWDID